MNEQRQTPRPPLTRELVLRRAVELADAGGLAALTMRSLAQALEVKPMSLYHHVASKEKMLDGLVDIVFAEVDLPVDGGSWRTVMERRAASLRGALGRHPWAIGLLETRTEPGSATLQHHDSVLRVLRGAGFSIEGAGHAYALLDSFIYGFALQEAGLPVGTPDSDPEVMQSMARSFSPSDLPYLAETAMHRAMQPGYAFGNEFGFGLGIILDGLEALLEREQKTPAEQDGLMPSPRRADSVD
ncbi:TetR/AcrR family transcriptional regulator [Arthrobacter luteolus]|uniref:TetR/AcrR family transcriptional regulator n=1 Tax=Arthrobacter luteolus TaxID=98672 RepID=UPI00385158AF